MKYLHSVDTNGYSMEQLHFWIRSKTCFLDIAHAIGVQPEHMERSFLLFVALCCILIAWHWFVRRQSQGQAKASQSCDVEVPMDEPAQSDAGWTAVRMPAILFAMLVLAVMVAFSVRGPSWWASISGSDKFEAHTMQCGTPDCRRDDGACGANVSTQRARNGQALDGRACCGDLMLAMLSEVGAWLDSQGFEWYVSYGTLLGAVRDRRIIRWTDDVDIVVVSPAALEALRQLRGFPYRFGRYGHTMVRGCADYPTVSPKLPHHPSGDGAHMWIGETPLAPLVSCEGPRCAGRKDPNGHSVPRKLALPGNAFVGRTAYYFMDIYLASDEPELIDPACGAFDAHGPTPRSTEHVQIGGMRFPTHRNMQKCLEFWYGSDYMMPSSTHVSDYTQ